MESPAVPASLRAIERRLSLDAVIPLVPVFRWILFDAPDADTLSRALLPPPRSSRHALLLLLKTLDYARRHGGPTVAWDAWRPVFVFFATRPGDDSLLSTAIIAAACAEDSSP